MDREQVDRLIFCESDDIVRGILLAIEELAGGGVDSFKDITVGRVCDQANISRATFYRHFKGVDGAVVWHMERSVTVGIGNVGRLLTWKEGFQVTLECAYFLRNTVRLLGGANLQKMIMHEQAFENLYSSLLEETIREVKQVAYDEELEFLVRSWTATISQNLNWWRLVEYSIPIPQFIEYLEECIPPKLYALLEEPTGRL